jgi:hypothetical protein
MLPLRLLLLLPLLLLPLLLLPLLPLLLVLPHPQELEGRGNHYHFILPGDMSTDAPRLLEEVDSFRAGEGLQAGEQAWNAAACCFDTTAKEGGLCCHVAVGGGQGR